jgi:hypothetical protein
MADKEKLMDVLSYGQAEVRGFVASLDEGQRAAIGSADRWSAKDVVGHLTEWIARLASDLDLAGQAQDAPHQVPFNYDAIDETNAEIYKQYQTLSWEEVMAKMEHSFATLNAHTQAAAPDELDDTSRIPWRQGRPLWRMLVGTAVEHPILHLSYFRLGHGNVAEAVRLEGDCVARLLELDGSPAWRGFQIYNLACIQALSGQVEKALANLGEALRLTPDLAEWAKQDPDLVGLHDNPAYQALYE